MKKLFEVHQKLTVLANEYRIFKDDQLAAYVKQKRFALREQFTLYGDEQQSTILATSKARQVMDLSPAFDVLDSNGKHLGVIKKEFKKSLFSSTWTIYYDEQLEKPAFKVTEKNTTIAVLRRLWELLPFVDMVPFPMRFHFSILDGDKTAGEYQKLTWVRDHYALHLDETYQTELDERVWMILAVLLDAMQSR